MSDTDVIARLLSSGSGGEKAIAYVVQLRAMLRESIAFLSESLCQPTRWSEADVVRIHELLKNANAALKEQ